MAFSNGLGRLSLKLEADTDKLERDLRRSERQARSTGRSFSSDLGKGLQSAKKSSHDYANAAVKDQERVKAATSKSSAGFGMMAASIGGAVAAIGAATVALSSFNAAVDKQALETQYKFTFGGLEAGKKELEEVRALSDKLGLSYAATEKSYVGFSVAAKGTKLEGAGVKAIFNSVAQASSVMNLSTEETQGSLLAIQQIMGKGKVSAEELRGQLGERLPGAFQIAARAMGVTTAELDKMLVNGELMAEEFLPKFAKQLSDETASGVAGAANTARANLARLGNGMQVLKEQIGSGLVSAFDSLVGSVKEYQEAVGKGSDVELLQENAAMNIKYAVDQISGAWKEVTKDVDLMDIAVKATADGMKELNNLAIAFNAYLRENPEVLELAKITLIEMGAASKLLAASFIQGYQELKILVGLLGQAIAFLSEAILFMGKLGQAINTDVTRKWNETKTATANYIAFVASNHSKMIAGVKSDVAGIAQFFVNVGRVASQTWDNVAKALSDAINGVLGPIMAEFNKFFGGIVDQATGMIDTLKEAGGAIVGALGGSGDGTGVMDTGGGSFGGGPAGKASAKSLAASMGLTVTDENRSPGTRTRSGGISLHALGRAIDFGGTPAQMKAFALKMAALYGSKLAELIYTPLGFSIKNGRKVAPYAQSDHFDHVHVGFNKGGRVPGSGPNRDSVPAMLTPGEFVLSREMVASLKKAQGMQFLNSGGWVKSKGSYYGGGEKLNSHTANGEKFNPNGKTAAHRSLPFGTKVEVRNPKNGKTVVVRINDRGPAAWTGRSIDLSKGAARAIGFSEGDIEYRKYTGKSSGKKSSSGSSSSKKSGSSNGSHSSHSHGSDGPTPAEVEAAKKESARVAAEKQEEYRQRVLDSVKALKDLTREVKSFGRDVAGTAYDDMLQKVDDSKAKTEDLVASIDEQIKANIKLQQENKKNTEAQKRQIELDKLRVQAINAGTAEELKIKKEYYDEINKLRQEEIKLIDEATIKSNEAMSLLAGRTLSTAVTAAENRGDEFDVARAQTDLALLQAKQNMQEEMLALDEQLLAAEEKSNVARAEGKLEDSTRYDSIANSIQLIIDKTQELNATELDHIEGQYKTLGETIETEAIGALKNGLGSLFEGVRSIEDIGKKLKDIFTNILDNVLSRFINFGLDKLFGSILGGINQGGSGGGLGGLLGGLFGGIPGFASGGTVGSTGLALVHKGEGVLNPRAMQAVGKSSLDALNNGRARPPQSSAGAINIRYESTVINNETYVTERQMQQAVQAGVQASQLGMMSKMKNGSPSFRSGVGLR